MRKSMENMFTGLEGFSVFLFIITIGTSISIRETITPGESIKDGDTLVSAGGIFELGFFSTGNSKTRYLGIWYKKVSAGTVVWVANRKIPVSDTSGILSINSQGILSLHNSSGGATIWFSNVSRAAHDPVAQLLDSGNLVVKDRNDDNLENFLWQSFSYPCNNFLPGMKIGRNLLTGFDTFVSSWASAVDPAQGQFYLGMDTRGLPQVVLKKGSQIMFRAGSWNGLYFTGKPITKPNPLYSYKFFFSDKEVYYEYVVQNSSILSRYEILPSGLIQRYIWNERKLDWETFSTAQSDQCSNYAFCGAYSSCYPLRPSPCSCLGGFVPGSGAPKDGNSVDWSAGCTRRTPLQCDGNADGFLKQTGLKLPDTASSWFVNSSMGLKECEEMCLRNCSCTAYTSLDIRDGSGCLLWPGDLIDTVEYTEGGQDLYIRIATSDPDYIRGKSKNTKQKVALIAASSIIAIVLLIVILVLYVQNKLREGTQDAELPIFDFAVKANATNNFSTDNKLGQGGFGPVYKGTLTDGQDIAAKRLSKESGQGPEEFKNEVTLIAKLQHRNLVKILGCCIKGNERMLIYEYMHNKSLNQIIFDIKRSEMLDWPGRMNVVDGIARGLLYLHQDSRLRIIHRDLKAGNILLDNNMNAKISDFGLARMFGGNQTEARTRRVVGTYGYMSPEYALDGRFSMKSDVFSFGVLVLEIVSGKRNRGFTHQDHDHNLLGHAWRLWMEERALDLIYNSVTDKHRESEVSRCIHVALLCVQQRPEDRPNMSSVLLMLHGEGSLPQPKQPGFFFERNLPPNESSSNHKSLGTNEVTITSLEAR